MCYIRLVNDECCYIMFKCLIDWDSEQINLIIEHFRKKSIWVFP